MSYTPSAAAQATAALAGSNEASLAAPLTALQNAITGGLLAPAAFMDAILSSVGFQGQSDVASLGLTNTSSTSFVDVGNGSSTGFSTYSFSAAIAKAYTVHVDTALYLSVLGTGQIFLQLVNTTTSTNYSTPSMTVEGTVDVLVRASFRVSVAMNVGANVLKLQWKVGTGGTANTDANSFRTFTITG